MKRLLTIFGSIAALAAASMLAFPETILIFNPGEKKNIWLQVAERDGADFTLTTADYWIVDEVGATSQTAAAVIEGSRIYSSVDSATWTEGSEYRLWVRWGAESDTDEIYINIVRISCGEEWE